MLRTGCMWENFGGSVKHHKWANPNQLKGKILVNDLKALVKLILIDDKNWRMNLNLLFSTKKFSTYGI